MIHRRSASIAAAALLVVACGSESPETNEPAPTATATAGDTASPRGTPGEAVEITQRLEHVDVRLDGPTPVGLIAEEETSGYPLHVIVANEGDTPVEMEHALARIAVELDGEIVCEAPDFGSLRLLDGASPVIEPHAETALAATLPCALTEHADYDVIADVLFAGDAEDVGVPAAGDPHESASLRISVSESEPAYQRSRPTLAEVPEGDPDS